MGRGRPRKQRNAKKPAPTTQCSLMNFFSTAKNEVLTKSDAPSPARKEVLKPAVKLQIKTPVKPETRAKTKQPQTPLRNSNAMKRKSPESKSRTPTAHKPQEDLSRVRTPAIPRVSPEPTQFGIVRISTPQCQPIPLFTGAILGRSLTSGICTHPKIDIGIGPEGNGISREQIQVLQIFADKVAVFVCSGAKNAVRICPNGAADFLLKVGRGKSLREGDRIQFDAYHKDQPQYVYKIVSLPYHNHRQDSTPVKRRKTQNVNGISNRVPLNKKLTPNPLHSNKDLRLNISNNDKVSDKHVTPPLTQSPSHEKKHKKAEMFAPSATTLLAKPSLPHPILQKTKKAKVSDNHAAPSVTKPLPKRSTRAAKRHRQYDNEISKNEIAVSNHENSPKQFIPNHDKNVSNDVGGFNTHFVPSVTETSPNASHPIQVHSKKNESKCIGVSNNLVRVRVRVNNVEVLDDHVTLSIDKSLLRFDRVIHEENITHVESKATHHRATHDNNNGNIDNVQVSQNPTPLSIDKPSPKPLESNPAIHTETTPCNSDTRSTINGTIAHEVSDDDALVDENIHPLTNNSENTQQLKEEHTHEHTISTSNLNKPKESPLDTKVDKMHDSNEISDDEPLSETNVVTELNPSLNKTLWRAVTSAQPHTGIGMFNQMFFVHGAIPNQCTLKKINDLIINGPKSEEITIIDPNKTELVTRFAAVLSQRPHHVNKLSWTDIAKCLALPTDLEAAETVTTQFKILSAAACTLEYISSIIKADVSDLLKTRELIARNRREYFKERPINGILNCPSGIREAFKYVARYTARCWVCYASTMMCSVSNAFGNLAFVVRRCSESLASICASTAVIYCIEEGLPLYHRDCAFLIKDCFCKEADEYSIPLELLKSLSLTFVLTFDGCAQGFQKKLAEVLGLSLELEEVLV